MCIYIYIYIIYNIDSNILHIMYMFESCSLSVLGTLETYASHRNFLATSVQLDLPMSWSSSDLQGATRDFHSIHPRCAMVKSRYIGDGHPTFNRNPYNGYINPYYWVDDHPLLYGNNGSLDPSTAISPVEHGFPSQV